MNVLNATELYTYKMVKVVNHMLGVFDHKKNPKIEGHSACLSNSVVPSGPPLRHSALPSTTGKGEVEVPTQTRLMLGLLSPINRCGSGTSSARGAQTPWPGSQPTPAQPVPSGSKHPTVLNLCEADPLGPGIFCNTSQPHPGQPASPGWGPHPCLAPGVSFIFSVSTSLFLPCPQEGML